MLKGYAGRILRVDLSTGTADSEAVPEEWARAFFGGRGFAADLLARELAAGTDPLGPGNKFVIATGPLAGSGVAGSTRHITACRSPLTGGWGEANAAGRFGPMMKAAGFDAIVVEGRADRPVYLWVTGGRVEVRDASGVWGLFTADAREALLRETHPGAEAAVIGPAGERGCLFACVISENDRAAGRSGTGAVMGSKNLKAVVVHGEDPAPVHDEERLAALRKEIVRLCLEHPNCRGLRENGTANGIGPHDALGMFPHRNFREGTSPRVGEVDGPTMTRTILSGRKACRGCPVACRRVVEVREGPFAVDPRYGGPELETIGALGTCVGLYDLRAIAKANELCNKYGLDTINTGLSIAWAMECSERGILTRADAGGLDLTWGNAETVLALIRQIAEGEGLGALLGKGLKAASAEVGRGSEEFAMQVKNQAFPVHMPRGKVGQGLSYATSNRGACHTQGIHDTSIEAGKTAPEIGFTDRYRGLSSRSKELKAEVEALAQNYRAAQDSLIVCRFTSWDYGPTTPAMLCEVLHAVTGWDVTPEELMLVGERVFNLCRLFNLREGFGRKDDTLPTRCGTNLPEGPCRDSVITKADLDRMLDEYYDFRGWTRDGVPTDETLRRLGLQRL